MRDQNNAADRIRAQLLNMMTATKAVIEARNTKAGLSTEAALAKLQEEYIRSIVLLKESAISPKIPALLRPKEPNLDRQTIEFRETLSVGLGEV